MTRQSAKVLPEAQPSGHRTARQLAAMRLLFDANRDVHETDVLLATVFEALADGATRTTDELLRQAEVDWPGVVIAREKLEAALEIAEERGFLSTQTALGGTSTWAITDTARLGVNDSKIWAEDVLKRCRAQVEDRAREQSISVTPEQAEYWTDLLLAVLHDGMVESFTQRPHEIRDVARRLFPPYERSKIIEAARSRIDDAGIADFLAALALSALDPGSTFGNEVVHYLATGYILYALLLGYDVTRERTELNDFAGEVLILDTPVLVRLLSGGKEFRWTSDLVGRIAAQAGAVVAVTVRTRRELAEMLQRRDGAARKIERELDDGVPRANLAAVAPDEVLAIWLREPSCPTWEQFKNSAATVLKTLKAVGVEVDYAPEGFQPDASARQRFADAIQQVTRERGRPRHDIPADHDGELLCLASHLRMARRGDGDQRIWPGAFVVTTDRSL